MSYVFEGLLIVGKGGWETPAEGHGVTLGADDVTSPKNFPATGVITKQDKK
jgi:hypothetical protein